MQISILSGVYTDNAPEFRTAYPVNLVPVPVRNGISNGYLRPAEGIATLANVPGIGRGGINWNGTLYRVLGNDLYRIDAAGAATLIGDVGSGGRVTMDYSFDKLAVASGGQLYLYDGATLAQVTDPDLGVVLDVVWVDGYFMTTDGQYLVVTELNDPFSVNPLRYGSSEVDPDPVVAVVKLRNEVYAVNRYTIEVFDNVGGSLFPFARIDGGQIEKGAYGTHSVCVFAETIAFLGSGYNETPGIYMGANALAQKISTQEIDTILQGYAEGELAQAVLEPRLDKSRNELWVRLPDRTLVFDAMASAALGEPAWHVRTTTLDGFARHRAADLVWCFDRWNVSDPEAARIGYLVDEVSSHWGEPVRWEFATTALYNESNGALVHRLELVGLTGRIAFGTEPRIATSYSLDGLVWSQPREILAGKFGLSQQRLCWFRQGMWRQWRSQRFTGTSDAHLSFARLEAAIEPLMY